LIEGEGVLAMVLFHRYGLRAAVLLAAAVIGACTNIGPATIDRDHMDYGTSIQQSTKQQLLGNIVGLRYMEAPLFVDVSSVINQYALTGSVQAGLGFNNSLLGGDSGIVGADGKWEDRPTITYSPISGKKFAESLLTPIKPEALFALVQSGWPADLMFRLTVSAINGLEDAKGGKQADPQFRELLATWARLRDARVIGLRRAPLGSDQKARIVVYVNDANISEQTRADLHYMHSVLKLDADAKEYELSYGLIPDDPAEIAVLTQSILDIMIDLARQIDVPPQHSEEGRTYETFVDSGIGGPLFRVHYSESRPEDAYTAVFNRGYWFYIDDRDMTTKRTFGVLQILLSLTDAGESAKGPVVSIGG
jgi:hypothetical protein